MELPVRRGRTVTPDSVPVGGELEQWIAIGYSVSVHAGDIITLALSTGLRWGETTALRPCDLDLDAGLCAVNQVVKEDENRRPYIASYGKSPAAQRTIRLPKRASAMLRRRIKGLARQALIFTGARGGILPSSGSWHTTHWSKVIKRAQQAGILTAVTPHKFRHPHGRHGGGGGMTTQLTVASARQTETRPTPAATLPEVATRRVITMTMLVIAGLAFAFSFGNIWTLARHLGVPAWIAPLVGPAVDLSVAGLLLAVRYLTLRGIEPRRLRPHVCCSPSRD